MHAPAPCKRARAPTASPQLGALGLGTVLFQFAVGFFASLIIATTPRVAAAHSESRHLVRGRAGELYWWCTLPNSCRSCHPCHSFAIATCTASNHHTPTAPTLCRHREQRHMACGLRC